MTRRTRLIPGLVAVALVALACSGSESPERDAGGALTCVTGSLGCSCTPQGTCDVNLVCQANVCSAGTGGTGAGGAPLLGGAAGLGGAVARGGGGTGGVTPTCGNAEIEFGETCDPCPTSCDDGNACTLDQMTGSANNCNVACTFTVITSCGPGDGCCPQGCDVVTDSDCPGGSGGTGGDGGTGGVGANGAGGSGTGGSGTGGNGIGAAGTGGAGTGGACSGGTTLCAEACVDAASDPYHCGACDSVCASGQICVNGTCIGEGTGGSSTGGAGTGGAGTGGTGTGGTGTGGAGTGGSGTGGSAGCSGASFQLSWEDDFDTIDSSRWQFMTHSLGLAQFTGDNASVSNGIVTLSLTDAPAGSALPYRGVEMRSTSTLTYGKVESSVRFAAGSGVISALVLIYTPWPPPDWNEIDIEFLGRSTDQVQFNTMIFIPPGDVIADHLQYPQVVTLGFGATAEFHTYGIEWVPGEVRFLVDGTLLHTATEEMSRMVLPQNILLTIWASESAAWAGAVNDDTAPTTVEYDWIRVCTYTG